MHTTTGGKKKYAAVFILLAMALGISLGLWLNQLITAHTITNPEEFLQPFGLLSEIFLLLIKMIISPLVFTTLVVGVAKQGDAKKIGRLGAKTMAWFIGCSLISLVLGMVLVNFFKPGVGLNFTLPPEAKAATKGISLVDFVHHIFPSSVFDAMARNEILQVVVFSIFFGVAAAALGEVAQPVVKLLDSTAHIILKMTTYIMGFAPIAVFGAMTKVIAKNGFAIIGTLSNYMGEFYLGLAILFLILMTLSYLFVGKKTFVLLKHIREPFLIAFSTNSSEAALPKLMIELERVGCEEKLVSFVLPLGYSFNLDGSMMYMTFASMFLLQAFQIHIDTGQQIAMLLTLMLTSKGIAGVPRASLVVVAATIATYHIPESGMAILLGIDPLLDMGRASMNVVGNSVATVVLNKMENGK